MNSRKFTEAIDEFLMAETIDHQYADLSFYMAVCYLRLNEKDKANAYFTKSMDFDTHRFRCDSQIIHITKNIYQKFSSDLFFLVDLAKILTESNNGLVPGFDLFYDHVHLTPDGNYLIASILNDLIPTIFPNITKTLTENSYSRQTLSLEECKEKLAFTKYNEIFANQTLRSFYSSAFHSKQMSCKTTLAMIDDRITYLKTSLHPKISHKCLQLYKDAVKSFPRDPWINFIYGKVLHNLNQYQESIQYLNAALQWMPKHIPSLSLLKQALNESKIN